MKAHRELWTSGAAWINEVTEEKLGYMKKGMEQFKEVIQEEQHRGVDPIWDMPDIDYGMLQCFFALYFGGDLEV